MYKLYIFITILNAIMTILYFTNQRPLLGGMWTIATIAWIIPTILNYKITKK